MIMINLLPHREERRRRKKIAFFAGLAVAAIVGLGGRRRLVPGRPAADLGPAGSATTTCRPRSQARHPDQGHRQPEGGDRLAEGAPEGGRGPADRPQRAGARAQRAREAGARGIYITAVKQDGQTLNVAGIAQTQERVSELLRNTAYNSEWLVKPELVESKAATIQGANKEQKRLFDFCGPPHRQASAGHARGSVAAASAACPAGSGAPASAPTVAVAKKT